MSRVSTYLNFPGTTEAAFTAYAAIFGTEFASPIVRIREMGAAPGATLTEDELNMVGHVALPILAGHVLMATDMVASQGQETKAGNTVTVNLEPDTREETDRLYAALSDGGTEATGMTDMPWGYWGCVVDRFGMRWMFNGPAAH